jgi:hypothetical protein
MLERKRPAFISAFNPLGRFGKKQPRPAALTVDMFLKTLDRIGQNGKHQSFFRAPLTPLLIYFEKAMRSKNIGLKK